MLLFIRKFEINDSGIKSFLLDFSSESHSDYAAEEEVLLHLLTEKKMKFSHNYHLS